MACELPVIATNVAGVPESYYTRVLAESLPCLALFLVVAQLAAPFLGTIHPVNQFVFVGPAAGASYVLFSTCARSQGTSFSNLNWLAL
jgi:hypothetical protein